MTGPMQGKKDGDRSSVFNMPFIDH